MSNLARFCILCNLVFIVFCSAPPAHATRTPPIASYTIKVTLDTKAKTLGVLILFSLKKDLHSFKMFYLKLVNLKHLSIIMSS